MNTAVSSQQLSSVTPIDRALVVFDGTSMSGREALLEKTKAISGALACDLHLIHCVDNASASLVHRNAYCINFFDQNSEKHYVLCRCKFKHTK